MGVSRFPPDVFPKNIFLCNYFLLQSLDNPLYFYKLFDSRARRGTSGASNAARQDPKSAIAGYNPLQSSERIARRGRRSIESWIRRSKNL